MTAADLPETVEGVVESVLVGHRWSIRGDGGGRCGCGETFGWNGEHSLAAHRAHVAAAVAAALAPREEPAPYRADDGALTQDERFALAEMVWAWMGADTTLAETVYPAVERILTTRLAAAGGRDTLAEICRNHFVRGEHVYAPCSWSSDEVCIYCSHPKPIALLAASGEGSDGEGEG